MTNPPPRPSKLTVITLTYAAAILAARFVSPPAWLLLTLISLCILAIWPLRHREAWAVLPGFFFLGMLTAPVSLRPSRDDISRFAGRRAEVIGQVASLPALGKSGGRLVLNAELVRPEGSPRRAVSGKLQAFLPPESLPECGDRIALTGLLSTPKPATNPGQFSYKDYLARQHIFATVRAKRPEDVRRLEPTSSVSLQRWASALRGSMLGVIDRALSPDRASVVGSMVFGMQAARVPEDTEADFRRSGTIHLLVVSGSQVMALVVMLLWIARRLLVPPKIAAIGIVPIVFFYALMTGAGSSVLRAAVAGALAAWAIGASRDTDRWTLLSAAALFILALNPMALYEISFQLTFGAVIGILAFTGPIYRWILSAETSTKRSPLRPLLAQVALLVSVSVAAQLTTTPLIAYDFQQFSLFGVFANLVAVPLAAMLVPLGIATAALGALWSPFGHVMGAVDGVVVDVLLQWVRVMAHLPGAYWALPPVPIEAVVGWYALLGVAALQPRWMTRERWALAGVCVLLLPLAVWAFSPAIKKPLRVCFLDVGKGRAAVIITPSGKAVLVNAGGRFGSPVNPFDSGERVVVPALRALGALRLDMVVVTDNANGHAGGLPAVIQEIPVKQALLPPSGRGLSKVLDALEERLVPVHRASAGAKVDFKDGSWMEVLGPGAGSDGPVTLRLCYRKTSIILSGDLDADSAANLLAGTPDLRADALSADWTGSESPQANLLAHAVLPTIVITGDERETPLLLALRGQAAREFRISRDGAVTLESKGDRLRVWRTLGGSGEKQSAH